MKTSCGWCYKNTIKAPKGFREGIDVAYCSTGCRDADSIFKTAFSDEEINRRTHYKELTKGYVAPVITEAIFGPKKP